MKWRCAALLLASGLPLGRANTNGCHRGSRMPLQLENGRSRSTQLDAHFDTRRTSEYFARRGAPYEVHKIDEHYLQEIWCPFESEDERSSHTDDVTDAVARM